MRNQRKKKVISVYGITIGNCPTTILKTGDTHQLTANVAPADADNITVFWSSSNPTVASVDENGLVSALNQGTVKITVTTDDGSYTRTCNIGVMSSTTGLENHLITNGINIYPNPVTNKLNIEFSKEDGNREIVMVNQNGQIVYKEYAIGLQKVIDMNKLNERGLIIVKIKSKDQFSVHKIVVLQNNIFQQN